MLKHLLATGKHTVTVLTRPDSKATFEAHDDLIVAKVDYASESSLVEALTGNDFLIITLSARISPSPHGDIVAAASKAGIPYIMPNFYGYGIGERAGTLMEDPVFGRFGIPIDDVRSYEHINWVALVCGFWYEFSVAMGEPWLGFNIEKRTAIFYGDGSRKINTSTWEQCGRALAGLLSLPVQKQDHGKPAVSDWAKEGLYVSSFLISQREILDSMHRVLGTEDKDWTITYEEPEERYRKGLEDMRAGNMLGFAQAMYARLLFPSGEGDYQTGGGIDNEKLGLPEEDLDEATKRAIEMVKGGYGYHD